MITKTVTQADSGIRLDRWFKRHFPLVPHGLLEKSLRKGMVRTDGRKCRAADRLETGQMISLPEEWANQPDTREAFPSRWRASEQDIMALKRSVLYRDANVLVINKPAGLAVQGGSGQFKHLDAMLDNLRFDAPERPRLVHRLDKDTSGCLALGRSARAAAALAEKFAAKETKKIYVALVLGLPMPMQGVISLPLAKLPRGKDSRMEAYETMEVSEASGKPAVTEYRVREHLSDKLSWVELVPVTGRTHQLRAHMAAIGHPIVGDGKYGGADAFVRGSLNITRQLCLHAKRLVIPDLFGKIVDVEAPLPPHIQESLEMLGVS